MGEVREAIDRRAGDISALAASHHADSIRLFGSVARGEDAEGSDADFLVEFGPDASILDVVHLRLDLERLLGYSVDVVPVGGLKERDAHLLEETLSAASAPSQSPLPRAWRRHSA